MHQLSLRAVLLGAGVYLVLDICWLAAATSSFVPETMRPALKVLFLVIACGVYAVMAGLFATRGEGNWMIRTAMNSSAAVTLGLVLMIFVSLLWYRGQFFHDATPADQVPSLALMLLLSAVVSGAGALLFGAAARLVWPVTTAGQV